jgi:CDP-6-deoxy-D-xylo-4-hexulose-3-dehydrase
MLLALSVLSSPLAQRPLRPGDEVITTAIPWSTTVAPVAQMGCIPVFVDIDRETLNIDVARIEDAISDRTRAIMPVHLLGNPVDMDAVLDIAERHDLIVVEDCCEAHGAATGGRRVGSFGTFSAFSFYFSHHISTIEGGLLLTDDDRLADIARAIRSHGWLRDVRGQWDFTGDSAEHPADWTFVANGYNLRPTELQGAFGIHQLGKLEGFVERRRQTARFWNESLSRFTGVLELPAEREHSRHVWFAYPILVRPGAPFTRAALLDFLNQRGIETRPVVAGNFVRQPVTKTWKHRTHGELAVASFVHEQGFLVGNHHRVSDQARQGLVDAIAAFLDAAARRSRVRAA